MASSALYLGMQPGFYSKNCQTQGNAVAACLDMLVRACNEVPYNHNQPLQVAEWGCSHGVNSILPVAVICETLRQRHAETAAVDAHSVRLCMPAGGQDYPLEIHITHEDVPGNDWSSMMAAIQEYQQLVDRVDCPPGFSLTSACTGTSMYERNFPSCSLDLGFSFTTLHWQSARACVPKHAVQTCVPPVSAEEHAVMRAHAMKDLETFLRLRAEEFKPGGMLVLSYCGEDSSKGLTNERHCHHLAAAQAAAEELVLQGVVKESELGAMAPPIYTLDVPQQQQVLAEVADLWELLHFDMHLCTSPLWGDYLVGKMSPGAYGKAFANFWRAISEPFIVDSLSQSGERDQQTVAATVDTMFEGMAAAAALNPQPMQWAASRVLLRRRGTTHSCDSSNTGSSM